MPDFSSLFTGAPAATAVPVSSPRRYRVLLVDDEPGILKALTRVFRLENYEVLASINASDALRVLRDQPVQVVISDYQMPGMNGGDFLKKVKELYPDTLRIMLTGHADTGAVMGAIKEGAVYKFILKPWNDDDLRVTVALALEQADLMARNRQLQEENRLRAKEITALSRLAVTHRSQLGIMLQKRGLLTSVQLQELMRQQQSRKESFIRLLFEHDWVSGEQIRALLRSELMLDEVSLPEFQVDRAVLDLIPRSFCERQWVLPLKIEGRRLMMAVADPLDDGLIDDMRFTSGLDIRVVMAPVDELRAKIAGLYGDEPVDFKELATMVASVDPYEGIEVVIDEDQDVPLDELLRGTDEPPAIRLANAIILEALRLGASDIHIQPRIKSVVVRYRIDGVLADKIQIPHQLHQSLVSRLKIMSELDISERRRPQDGRITVKTPLRMVDLRISTLPTINGEKVVMRILDRNSAVLGMARLGFTPDEQEIIECLVAKPQGLLLATGPTGSGKTTTLYSLLQHNATPAKNYITIEDPVEYTLDAAGQVLVREKIGLDFTSVLRAVLRQDPDVILLGEIRDHATAEVAFHAAMTGHQVFSTLHTNSAVATVARLIDLGLKPFIVASALEGIIAQRLVRKICMACREPVVPSETLRSRLGPLFVNPEIRYFAGQGCGRCHGTGYLGRLALYEILVPDAGLRELIGQGASTLELQQHALAKGMRPLIADAARKVHEGLTSIEEIMRVLGPQEG